MALENILVATAILWGLTILFVRPLTFHLIRRKLQEPAYAHLRVGNPEELDEAQKAELEKLVTQCYILADVTVLSIAGFIGGLLGYWFIGIAFDAKNWPGVLAFIVSSFLGLSIRSGFS